MTIDMRFLFYLFLAGVGIAAHEWSDIGWLDFIGTVDVVLAMFGAYDAGRRFEREQVRR